MAALPTHVDPGLLPVNVTQPEMGDVARAKAQTGEQQQNGTIRRPTGDAGSHDAITRSTSSGGRDRGSTASRQCATRGMAASNPTAQWPSVIRNRTNIRTVAAQAWTVAEPQRRPRLETKARKLCASHWLGTSPSCVSSSRTYRRWRDRVATQVPRCRRIHSQYLDRSVPSAATESVTGNVVLIPVSRRYFTNRRVPCVSPAG